MSEDNTVGTISLGGSSTLVFSVSQWRGRYFAGVRKFVSTQKYEGPTKSGLMLTNNQLRELATSLERLEKTIPSQEESEFKTITKNETEYIRIGTVPDNEYEELPWVDVREFVDRPTYQGPTKRGIRFRWNLLPDVLACLREQIKVIGEREKNQPTLFESESVGFEKELKEKLELNNTVSLFELLGEELKLFPEDFLERSVSKCTRVKLPEEQLHLAQDSTGTYFLKTEDGFFAEVRNPTEANFILYAQLRGHREVFLPKEMINIFKTVKSYENYVRSLRLRLFAKFFKKARQESVANYETDKLFRSHGLPILKT